MNPRTPSSLKKSRGTGTAAALLPANQPAQSGRLSLPCKKRRRSSMRANPGRKFSDHCYSSTMRNRIAVILWMAVSASGAPPVPLRKLYPPTNDVAIDHHVSITMRDGWVLYADVCRPIKKYKYPVLVSRRLIARSDIPALTRSLYFSPAGVTFTCFRTCEDV